MFRVLPRATNEAPILPCPRPPIYIILFILLSPLISPLPHRVRLSTICSEHPSRSSLLTSPHPSPEAHQCNISPYRRAQNSSHVRIKPHQLILIHPHFLFRTATFYPSVQLALSLSLLPLSLFRHSLLRIFVWNSNPQKRKKYL